MIKILFIGCVESSYKLLAELIARRKNVVGVITKKQSGFNADYCDLALLCGSHNIPCHFVKSANDPDSLAFIQSLSPDVCFCFGWSQLLKEELIRLFPAGAVGFHPAKLPDNRGRHPLIWALALGLKETASTFFMLNAGADEGDIVSQRKVEIAYEDDARTLYDKVMDIAVKQEIELVERLESGNVVRVKQNANAGNFWRKRGKEDGRIDWRMSSRAIYNLVRSLTRPYVGAHFVHHGTEWKVWKAQELDVKDVENIEPGKALALNDDGTVDVKAGDGAVRLVEFDRPKISEGDYLL